MESEETRFFSTIAAAVITIKQLTFQIIPNVAKTFVVTHKTASTS